MPPPGMTGGFVRGTAPPITGLPSRGRLNSGTPPAVPADPVASDVRAAPRIPDRSRAPLLPALLRLNDFAVEFRYPGHAATAHDVKAARQDAAAVRKEVRFSLGVPAR